MTEPDWDAVMERETEARMDARWMGEILAQIPPPDRHLLFLKCPRCGHRTWNCHGAEIIGYQGHYMKHILDDMRDEAPGGLD